MTEEEKKRMKQLEDDLAKAIAEKAVAEAKAQELAESNEKLGEDIKKKDEVIEQKTKDAVGARNTYKKLADMTEAEKGALSAKELELQARQEQLEADRAADQKARDEFQSKQVASAKAAVFKKFIGAAKPEIAKKFQEYFDKIKDSDKAVTPEEIEANATLAFNMLGNDRPSPVRAVVQSDGGEAPAYNEDGTPKKDFSETKEGKDLAGALNLAIAQPAGTVDSTKK